MGDATPSPADAVRIDYVEFSATDLPAIKRFYTAAFGWAFTDYGDAYTAFNCGNLNGGFAKADSVRPSSPLIVLYAKDLAAAERNVTQAGGRIIKPTYAFPGGKRFHFADPSGNELAVWSE